MWCGSGDTPQHARPWKIDSPKAIKQNKKIKKYILYVYYKSIYITPKQLKKIKVYFAYIAKAIYNLY